MEPARGEFKHSPRVYRKWALPVWRATGIPYRHLPGPTLPTLKGLGAYYDLPGAPQEYYATAGMGRVDPGIDISHYGAPYQGMLGLGTYVEMPGYRGAEYATAGMGLGQSWSPGPGQTPADDPRMVKQYATVKGDYQARNIGSGLTTRAADEVVNEAKRQFAGMTVSKIGTTGWTKQGRVGFEVILRTPMRAGDIKRKVAAIGSLAGPRVGTNTQLIGALTYITPSDFVEAVLEPGAPDVAVPESAGEGGGFFSAKVGGVPAWALGALGLVAVGGLVFAVTRKKPAAVAANRRRRRRRRSSRRRRR